MFKNVASQKVTVLAIDTATNLPKTGDAANLTAYVSKDDGAVTALGDTSASELDATNAPGLYSFDCTQTETNADKLVFSGKSSTSGVRVVPVTIYTRAANINDLVIDGSGNLTGNITGNLSGSVGSVTGNVGGNVTGSVGSVATGGITAASIATDAIDADAIADGAIDNGAFADGAITAAKIASGAITSAKFAAGAIDATAIATDAIDADALKADAITEIQSGLATAAGVSAVEADTQDIQSRLPAALVSGRMASDAVAISGSTVAADAVEANISNLDATVSSRLASASYSAPPSAADIADAVWDELRSGHTAAGSFGEYVMADAKLISGSATAADNAEIVFATDFAANYDTTGDCWLARLDDGVTHGGTSALLRLGSSTSTPAIYVTNSGGNVVRFQATGGNGTALKLDADGTGHGLAAVGGSSDGDGFNLGGGGGGPAGAGAAINGGLRGNVTGNVSGSVTGSVGSLAAQAQTDVRTAVGLASANLDTQLGDLPTVSEFEARTLLAASYATAANQVTIAGYIDTEVAAILAAAQAIKAKTDNLPAAPAATGDIPSAATIADTVLGRSITNVEATAADKHCLALLVALSTNASESGGTVTAKKPSDDSTWFTYTVTTDAGAELITAVS